MLYNIVKLISIIVLLSTTVMFGVCLMGPFTAVHFVRTAAIEARPSFSRVLAIEQATEMALP